MLRNRTPSSRGVLAGNDTNVSRGRPERFRSGLTVYLDYRSGFAAAQWTDLSGTAHHYTQGTGGNQGTNGATGVVFNGTSTYYTGSTVDTVTTSTTWTLLWGGQIDAVDTNNASTYLNDAIIGDSSTEQFGIYLKSAPAAYAYCWDGADKNSGALSFTAATQMILTARQAAGTLGIRKNGGTEQTGATGTRLADATVTELGRGAAANYFSGKMKLLIIFNRALSTPETARIQHWAAAVTGVAA